MKETANNIGNDSSSIKKGKTRIEFFTDLKDSLDSLLGDLDNKITQMEKEKWHGKK